MAVNVCQHEHVSAGCQRRRKSRCQGTEGEATGVQPERRMAGPASAVASAEDLLYTATGVTVDKNKNEKIEKPEVNGKVACVGCVMSN